MISCIAVHRTVISGSVVQRTVISCSVVYSTVISLTLERCSTVYCTFTVLFQRTVLCIVVEQCNVTYKDVVQYSVLYYYSSVLYCTLPLPSWGEVSITNDQRAQPIMGCPH